MSPREGRNSSFLTSRSSSYEDCAKTFENELNNNKTVSFLLAFSLFPPPFFVKGPKLYVVSLCTYIIVLMQRCMYSPRNTMLTKYVHADRNAALDCFPDSSGSF